jgi:hypothetical protein
MKKFLLFVMMCVCVSIGTWAGTIANNNGTITLDGLSAGNLKTALTDPTVWTSGSADDLDTATKVVFGSNVTLNNEDLAALKTLIPAATQLNMAQVTLDADANIANLETAAVEYLRLPNTMTSEDDVKKMKSLKTKNSALKMVGAYDPDNSEFDDSSKKWAEVSMHSFEANNVTSFLTAMDMPTSGNPTVVPRKIKMSGEYGDKDLVSGGTPNFGYETSAEWDFTGAHFAKCEIPAPLNDQGEPAVTYYNYDDPFCVGALTAPTTSSNTFYYFSQYAKQVVDIKLPDTNMTNLPYRCLNDLAALNSSGYKALYGDDAYTANKVANEECVPVETLVIPDCYTDLEEECGKWARIRHLVVGSGMKRIHGGAFLKCDFLEDLDFGAGLSDCYVGDHAFNECKSMKHIALSEGIVSVGNYAFYNSQNLESIRLPETLLYIGDHAFDNCLALNSIVIPSNVRQIGRCAFTLCPLTDIFLTTTDPEKIPIMWSAGSSENYLSISGNCSFYNSAMNGWGTIQGLNINAHNYQHLENMTWDEAVAWYFIHENGLPVLHYPKQLADKVRANISKTYHTHTKADENGVQYGLPIFEDLDKRGRISGADLGDANGKWTTDGWAQFLLMKEFTTDPGHDVYQKEYKDVWYTMCFPFDLTDEQLAAAFNETFNIVDFSGIQLEDVPSKEDPSKTVKQMILHFDRVAVTDYKDTEGKHYKRVMEDGNPKREKDGTYEYNVYEDDEGHQYHHVITITKGDLNKSKIKTFVRGTSLVNSKQNFDNKTYDAVLIDGILATAGHPYMIHPAIGVKAGSPAKRCTFAGISWLPQGSTAGKPLEGWRILFEQQSRTIDLGEKKDGTITEYADSNYNQKQHAGYGGQKYTFIGNYHEYDNSVLTAGIEDEPQVPEKPVEPTIPTSAPTQPTTAEMQEPEKATNPDEDTDTYPAAFKSFYITEYHIGNGVYGPVGEGISGWNFSDVASGPHAWGASYYQLDSNHASAAFYDYFDPTNISSRGNKDAILATLFDSDKFQTLKEKCGAYKQALEKYQGYDALYAAYLKSKKEWDDYRTQSDLYFNGKDGSAYQAYLAALGEYNEAVTNHGKWEAKVKPYKVQIPQYAYFLGTKKGDTYPKYFRETAAENYPSTRKSGLWPQFTAVIIPNTVALAGIEAELDGVTQSHNGSKIAFNEDYFIIDEFGPQGIATVIENAKRENPDTKVEHIDIVVSIDGKVVSRDKTTFEGLPKGVYIVNGKKYYVK